MSQLQTLKFIQACPPAFEDGEYRISVDQNVTLSAREVKTLNTVQEFSVKGARFKLNPDDIDSVFPPANQTGNYSNCLPHIIINKKTFAWERSIFGEKARRIEAGNEPIDAIPWVALLSFSKSEAPEIIKNTAKSILYPETNIITGNINLDEHIGESVSTPCLTIDIPAALFNEIAPNIEELRYLAHSRYVKLDSKCASYDRDGYYSVIIGNRFPLASDDGETNIAHLVSLEGLGNYLPGGSSPVADPNKSIRLISLVNWQYAAKSEKQDFRKLVNNLDRGIGLSVPVSASDSQIEVKSALSMGFAALNHSLRVGERTVSWYRGPFVPLKVSNEEIKCSPNSDSLLKYDPKTGMFDLSYSAAWQIGLMLALQNKSFAAELFKWRRMNNQNLAFFKMRETLEFRLGSIFEQSSQMMIPEDSLIHNIFAGYWQNCLWPKLKQQSKDDESAPLKICDSSGLLKNSSNLPGLLAANDLKDIVENSEDPINSIIQRAKGMNL